MKIRSSLIGANLLALHSCQAALVANITTNRAIEIVKTAEPVAPKAQQVKANLAQPMTGAAKNKLPAEDGSSHYHDSGFFLIDSMDGAPGDPTRRREEAITLICLVGSLTAGSALFFIGLKAKQCVTAWREKQNLQKLEQPTPWEKLPIVSNDAPLADDCCLICLNTQSEMIEPIRIRQPDGRFTNKLLDYQCILTDMRYRSSNKQAWRDPSNQQSFAFRDIFRELSPAHHEAITDDDDIESQALSQDRLKSA